MTGNSWQHIRGLWRASSVRPVANRDTVRCLRRHFDAPNIVERMALLNDFIKRTNGGPFVWGVSDCTLMVADWCVETGHDDPAEAWRGAYSTEDECRALITERGDLAAVVSACASAAGLKPIAEPEFGCVAVIGSRTNPNRQWAAIWSGSRWAVRWGNERKSAWTPMAALALGMWRV